MSSTVKSIPAGSEAKFDEYMKTFEQDAIEKKADNMYVVITSSHDATTGLPWCGDCRVSEPLLRKTLSTMNAYLVEAFVDRADFKGVENHPYRVHPQLKVARIPTLYKWVDGVATDSLVEGDVYDKEKLAAFLGLSQIE